MRTVADRDDHSMPLFSPYAAELLDEPAMAGQYLGCCGMWQRIDAIPFTCLACGARYLEGIPDGR